MVNTFQYIIFPTIIMYSNSRNIIKPYHVMYSSTSSVFFFPHMLCMYSNTLQRIIFPTHAKH